MGNHGAAGVPQNAGVLIVLVYYILSNGYLFHQIERKKEEMSLYYQNIILSHLKKRSQRRHGYEDLRTDIRHEQPTMKKTDDKKQEASMRCSLLHCMRTNSLKTSIHPACPVRSVTPTALDRLLPY